MARSSAVLLVLVMVGCGSETWVPPKLRDPDTIKDAPPAYDPPSLTARIEYAAPRSSIGVGSFDLTAHPEDHEFRVGLMVGEASQEKRWSRCYQLDLSLDDELVKLPARYSGVGMENGFYDAMTVELTIEHVRRMSEAETVVAELCGDTVEVPLEQRLELVHFVRQFEEMATHDGPPPPAPPPALDRRNDLEIPDLPQRRIPA